MPPETVPPTVQTWESIYSMPITSDECVSEVRSILNCRSKIQSIRNLRGNEAQNFVDFLDQVLTRSCLDNKYQRRGILLLSKICKARAIIPSSYILQMEVRIGVVRHCSRFADVTEGEYLGSPVAIKQPRMNESSERVFKRLCREIIGWRHLSHPNILPLLGISASTDPYCFRILTEWMPNGNVMEYARKNTEANRLRLLSQVASGVAYLHELKIVHGDLKGANILVDNNGTARLTDFGLMTILIEQSTNPLSATTISSAGTVCWMSPELLFGKNSSPTRQSDCYALGMVIYEVLTGLRPFHHFSSFPIVVVAVQKGKRPEKPSNAKSLGLSDALWGLVLRCWNKSSTTRPTARQLLRCLQDASPTWEPSPRYPIPDGLDGRTGPDPSSSGWSTGSGARTSRFFALFGVLCGPIFSFARVSRTPVA